MLTTIRFIASAVLLALRWLIAPLLRVTNAAHATPFAAPGRAAPDPAVFPRYFQAPRTGLWLRWSEWWPRDPRYAAAPRGLVLVVSGLAEHAGRYDALGIRLATEGLAVVSLDHQGQGASEGTRLYFERFSDLVDDQLAFLDDRLRRDPHLATGFGPVPAAGATVSGRLPVLLFGHSMGGLVSVHMAMRRPALWACLALSGPALMPDPATATPTLIAAARRLSAVVPKLGLQPIHATDATGSPQVVQLAAQDPLMPKVKVSARWGHEMLCAMNEAATGAHKVVSPLLVVHGERDRLAAPEGSRRLLGSVGSNDKELRVLPGAMHEVLTEGTPTAFRALAAVVDFFVGHAATAAAPDSAAPTCAPIPPS